METVEEFYLYLEKINVLSLKKRIVSHNLCIKIAINTDYNKLELALNKITITFDEDASEALVGRLSTPNLLQFGLSFSASAKTFLSNPKSNWKLLRGISPTCGNK